MIDIPRLIFSSQSSFALPPGFDTSDETVSLSDLFPHYKEVKERTTILTPEEAQQANAVLLLRIDKYLILKQFIIPP